MEFMCVCLYIYIHIHISIYVYIYIWFVFFGPNFFGGHHDVKNKYNYVIMKPDTTVYFRVSRRALQVPLTVDSL